MSVSCILLYVLPCANTQSCTRTDSPLFFNPFLVCVWGGPPLTMYQLVGLFIAEIMSVALTIQTQLKCMTFTRLMYHYTCLMAQLFIAGVAVWMCESAKSTCAVALAVLQLFVCCAFKFLQACVVWQFKNEAATQLRVALLWIWMMSAGDCTEAIKHFLCVNVHLQFSFFFYAWVVSSHEC